MSQDTSPSTPPSPPAAVFGQQILSDYFGCDAAILDDLTQLQILLMAAARYARATPVCQEFHRFLPHGISGVVIIAESHLTIHTWPEHGYAAVDFFTCGAHTNPLLAHQLLTTSLRAKDSRYQILQRGIPAPPSPRAI